MKRVKAPIKKKVIGFSYLTFPQRIESLDNELKKLIDALPLYVYFNKIRKRKNSYIVEMRKIVAEDLLAKNYTIIEISKILCKDHSSILHLLTINRDPNVENAVKLNYNDWINNNVYPDIKRKREPAYHTHTGFTTVLDYVIKNLK